MRLERMEAAGRALIGGRAQADAEAVNAIIDLMSARLGPKAVLRAVLHETHQPEKAGAWSAALGKKKSAPAPAPSRDGVVRRPLTLFAPPQPIEALAAVPDGPPIRFRWRRVLREVARAEGPERISGDWMGAAAVRDYYRVEDREGRRYWLYREGLYGEAEPPRWFVHGLFA